MYLDIDKGIKPTDRQFSQAHLSNKTLSPTGKRTEEHIYRKILYMPVWHNCLSTDRHTKLYNIGLFLIHRHER